MLQTRRQFLATTLFAAAVLTTRGLLTRSAAAAAGDIIRFDVCVYGGTASGVMAAVAAAKAGMRVVLVEPSRWLGGMTGGGLTHIDWGRGAAFGSNVRQVLRDGQTDPQYRTLFAGMLKEAAVTVIYEHRISAVRKSGATLQAITLDHAPPDAFGCPPPNPKIAAAMEVSALVYVDCSYEGDLMSRAGVSYVFGRESAEEFGESLAGVRPPLATYAIDPYVTPGDARSGLLPLVLDYHPGPQGSADKLTMGYGFRWKFSTGPDRLPIDPPEDYDPRTFEIYRRGFKSKVNMGAGRRMHKLGVYEPDGGGVYKMGAGNLSRSLWAPTAWGCNANYPDGDYATRSKIWRFHQDFMRGVTHFLRTDPDAPPNQKNQAVAIGFQPGQFDDTAGWPHQLYVREARRMRSSYVVTQHHLAGETEPDDPVALASYGVDDWPYATHPHEGGIAVQGGEFSVLYLTDRHAGIYRVPYRAIVPHKRECDNLLVPVCCSASHIAMTSIRMEPVWITLGQSAGIAAASAVKEHLAVQDIAYAPLRTRLVEAGIKLDPPA